MPRKYIRTKPKKTPPRCNICGVPESKFKDGICRDCGDKQYCTMDDPSLMVEQRVFDYAKAHNMLAHSLRPQSFDPATARRACYRTTLGNTIPKYVREAISCDGMTFDLLAHMPEDERLRVCRENPDNIIRLRIGRIVVRQGRELRILPDDVVLDIPDANMAIQGVHFEQE